MFMWAYLHVLHIFQYDLYRRLKYTIVVKWYTGDMPMIVNSARPHVWYKNIIIISLETSN